MKHFWIVDQNSNQDTNDTNDINDTDTNDQITNGSYWSDGTFRKIYIKLNPDHIYESSNKKDWKLVNSNYVFYQSDVDKAILIVYVMTWSLAFYKMVIFDMSVLF